MLSRSRRISVFVVFVLLAGNAVATPAQAGIATPAGDPLAGLTRWRPGSDPVAPPVPAATSAPRIRDEPWRGPVPVVRLPRPERAEIVLAREPRRVGESPISLAAKAGDGVVAGSAVTASAGAGGVVAVEVHDQETVRRTGAAGMVFSLSGVDGPVEVSVDYSGIAGMFGAGFGDRLRLVSLPSCALLARPDAGCATAGTPLAGRNDAQARTLSATLDGPQERATLDGPQATVIAVMAGPGGELEGSGDFKATPFEMSSDWQVGVGSGEFSWSYKVALPKAPGGPTPEFTVNYSSGAIDGLTSTRNTQAGQLGVGWAEFANAFVERRYTPCIEDPDDFPAIGDLCWKNDNATLSLNGRAADLVRVPNSNPKQWRLKRDPRWRVEQLTGALSNGDSDREYWKVTTPDGVQYFFGLGVKPESGNAATNSVYTVPVLANNDGEPCRGAAAGNIGDNFCQQAWRWNLDRVVDPNGNVTTYQYSPSVNYYRAILGFAGWQPYVRSGQLRLIEYGGNTGEFNGGVAVGPQARVDVSGAHRCESLDPGTGCQAPTTPTPGTTPATRYPDVPVDQICTSPAGSGCNNNFSPTFFTTMRYTRLTTQVLVAGAWKPVDEVVFTHRFEAENANGTGNKKLYLTGLQRSGLSASPSIALPGVEFGLTRLDNRVINAGSTVSRMPHLRVTSVVDEFGRALTVTYGQPHPCATTDPPPGGWDNNQRNCFRQQYLPEGATDPNWGVFNKWLVTQVMVQDRTGGSPAMTTGYTYGAAAGDTTGDPYPAWHYDTDAYFKEGDLQWTEWRGYDTVLVTQSSARTRHRVHRGMHRDRTGTGGEKTVDSRSLDGSLVTRDFDWLVGRTLDEVQFAGDGSVIKGAIHEYQTAATVDDDSIAGNEPHPFKAAVWAAEKTVTSRTRKDGGGFISSRVTTSYNGLLLWPELVASEGRLDVAGDERCTKTGYTLDVNRWMLDFATSTTVVQGTCASTTVLSETQYAYDGGAVGAAPSRGNVTNSRVRVSGTTYAETKTTHDALGRPRVVTDPNGRNTTTVHIPATGLPVRTEVTNHLGHKATTTWKAERQVAATQIDARGKVVTQAYDALGRNTRVWQPTEPTSGPASWEFSYAISAAKNAPPAIRTRRLQSLSPAAVYLDSWTIYDSLLRERQTQRLSTAAGKAIVSNTRYNDRGLAESVSPGQALTGTPGALLNPAAGIPWDNEEMTAYDEIGRPVWDIFFSKGAGRWGTIRTYGHDTIKAVPQLGGEVVTTVDADGRVTKVAEWAVRGNVSSAKTTSYAYDGAGRMTRVTDPRGNTITYTYDLAGRRTGMTDRDAGTWTYGWDLAGNQTSVRDARGITTFAVYDAINRPTAYHAGDATKPLASFGYDASGEAGLLDFSIRWVRTAGQPDRAYVTDVLGYDDRARPNGRSWIFFDVDLPGVALPEGSTFPVTYGYDRADHVVEVGYPQIGIVGSGGLAAERVRTTYNNLGLPVGIDSDALPLDQDYLYATGYDERARPLLFGYGKEGSGIAKVWLYDVDQRLSRQQAFASGSLIQDREITYQLADSGNVSKRKNTLNGRTWMDCYGYDDRHRLTRAYTTSHADDCGVAGAGGGDGPYNHTYAYSDDGNITSRVEDGDTVTYTYPPAGATSVRPHAPTRLDFPGGGDDMDYTWDANGQMLTRVRGGTTETFTWDEDRRLTAIETRNATGSSTGSFTYDTGGQRLVRRNVDRNTAYFAGHEVSVTNGGHVTTVRTYTLGGAAIATRTASGGDDPRKDQVEYLIADTQGSVELAARNSESSPTVDRTYNPYGAKRTGNNPATDRGWIGQFEDRRTELSYLNNRYYDPELYRFVSPDPVADMANPQTYNPYMYGVNNPIRYVDPTGLCGLEWGWDNVADCAGGAAEAAADGADWAWDNTGGAVVAGIDNLIDACVANPRGCLEFFDPLFDFLTTLKKIQEYLQTVHVCMMMPSCVQRSIAGAIGGVSNCPKGRSKLSCGARGAEAGAASVGITRQGVEDVGTFIRNAPVTAVTVAANSWTHGDCDLEEHLVVVCYDGVVSDLGLTDAWVTGGTINTTFTKEEFAEENGGELLAHESAHVRQQSMLGPLGFVVTYGANYGVSEALTDSQCLNVFEWRAGFEGGGYDEC